MQHNVPNQYRFNVGQESQPIAGSMPVNRIRRWPNIETELGDCPVFALTAIRVTLSPSKGHYPNNVHDTSGQLWNNVEPPSATLGQHYSNQNFKLLATNIIVNIFFSEDFVNTKVQDVGNYYVHKDWCTEMWTVTHTHHHSFP